MKIKVPNIKNDISLENFPNILLIDLERKSKFNIFSNLNNEIPNFSRKILSTEGNKLLAQLFSYADKMEQLLSISTIGFDTSELPINEFNKIMQEELDYIIKFHNTFTFVISTTNYNSIELHSIAKWAEENDKLYFVSITNEEDYNKLALYKFPNVIACKSGEFVYDAEIIVADIFHIFKEPQFDRYVDDIAGKYKTLSGESLNSKLYAIFFKNVLVNKIFNIFAKHPVDIFSDKSGQYPMTIVDYHEIIKNILEYTLQPFTKYFYAYPQKFTLSYNLIPNLDEEESISISFKIDDHENIIKIEF